MSTFASLRAARQSKQSKSYVKSNNEIQKPSTTSEGVDLPNHVEVVHILPPNVDVRLSNTCGRGSWAKIQHKPGGYSVSIVMSRLDTESLFELGDILFSLKPHVATLSNQHLDAYCSNCFGSPPAAGLKRCTRCRIVWYCSLVRSTLFSREYGFFYQPLQACQTKDWLLHKRECVSLQEWSKQAPSTELAIPSDAVRCLGRMLWKKRKRGLDSVWVFLFFGVQFYPPLTHQFRQRSSTQCNRVSCVGDSTS